MQTRLQDDVLGADRVQQFYLFMSAIHTYQLLVQGYWQRRRCAETGHSCPLVLPDRLFYGMDVVLRQCLQSAHGLIWRETTISIHPKLNLFPRERFTNV